MFNRYQLIFIAGIMSCLLTVVYSIAFRFRYGWDWRSLLFTVWCLVSGLIVYYALWQLDKQAKIKAKNRWGKIYIDSVKFTAWGMDVAWSTGNEFGNLSINIGPEGKLYIDHEHMSKAFCMAILITLIEENYIAPNQNKA